jgi:hypothetical protein
MGFRAIAVLYSRFFVQRVIVFYEGCTAAHTASGMKWDFRSLFAWPIEHEQLSSFRPAAPERLFS